MSPGQNCWPRTPGSIGNLERRQLLLQQHGLWARLCVRAWFPWGMEPAIPAVAVTGTLELGTIRSRPDLRSNDRSEGRQVPGTIAWGAGVLQDCGDLPGGIRPSATHVNEYTARQSAGAYSRPHSAIRAPTPTSPTNGYDRAPVPNYVRAAGRRRCPGQQQALCCASGSRAASMAITLEVLHSQVRVHRL